MQVDTRHLPVLTVRGAPLPMEKEAPAEAATGEEAAALAVADGDGEGELDAAAAAAAVAALGDAIGDADAFDLAEVGEVAPHPGSTGAPAGGLLTFAAFASDGLAKKLCDPLVRP